MIKYSFTYQGKTIKAEAPQNWNEVKLKHYINLETDKSAIEMLAFMSDVDRLALLNTKKDLTPVLNLVVRFLNQNPPDFKKVKPSRYIVLGGKKIKLPSDLNEISFGQSAMIEKALQDNEGDQRKALPMALAVVLQPLFDNGDFDDKRVNDVLEMVNDLPIIEALPAVFFFYQTLEGFVIFGQMNLIN